MRKKGIADRIRDRYSIQEVMDMVGVAVDWNASLSITSYVWVQGLKAGELDYYLGDEVEEDDDDAWFM